MPFKLNTFGTDLGNAARGAAGSAVSGALGKAANKLPPILRGPVKGLIGDVFGTKGGGKSQIVVKLSDTKLIQDWRASLTWADGDDNFDSSPIFKKLPVRSGIADKKHPTVIWPFTPQVGINYTANYDPIQTQQTNYATPAYTHSNVSDIIVSGEFVANTLGDANYLYACIHFLKSATRSFNASDKLSKAGDPPVVLSFNYLGSGGFNNMPVVITAFNMSYPKEVDYVACNIGTIYSMVPAECTISVTLMPAFSRAHLAGFNVERQQYSTAKFINGDLINGGHF
jgi:hypothetical protein